MARPGRWILALVLGGVLLPAVLAAPSELGAIRELAQQGQSAEALQKLEGYLASHPAEADARFLKGVLLAEQNRTEAAIEVFEALTRDYPELPEPYNNLAVLYAAQGDYTRARDELLLAINTHPSYATAHENLGDIYAKLAGMAYDKALELDSANEAAKAKLALIDELFSERRGAPGRPVIAAAPPAAAAGAAAPAGAPPGAPPAPESAPTVPPAPQSAAAAAPAPESAAVAPPVPQASAAAPEPAPQASPQPPPEPPSEPPPVTGEQILATVHAWAEAWSAQDVERYLSFYGHHFRPADGRSRRHWERLRRKRVGGPDFIQVDLEALDVDVLGPDRARVSFTQRYRSDSYHDVVRKTLWLAKAETGWKIVREDSQ